jgi:hypothetical protein
MSAWRSKVSLNSSRPLRTFPREGTFLDESPALTAVLQAQPRRIVPSGAARRAGTDARRGLARPAGAAGRDWEGRARHGKPPDVAGGSPGYAFAPDRGSLVRRSAGR